MSERYTWTNCCALVLMAVPIYAFAQNAPVPPAEPPAAGPGASAGQQPFFDLRQYPAYKGQVQQFTLTPGGDVDGFILRDGTEVKTPRHLSTEIAYSVKVGDTVVVRGLRVSALPLVVAVALTDAASGRTVVDTGGPRDRPGAQASASDGRWLASATPGFVGVRERVRMLLHGARGEANGALLEDGTVLRLTPPEAYRLSSLLQQGQDVFAEGVGFSSALGNVIEVRLIGPSREQLTVVQAPPKRGKKGRKGPPGPEVGDFALRPVPLAPPPPRP